MSGTASGSTVYTQIMKYHLGQPRSGRTQQKDDYPCQGPSNMLLGGWSHDQLPKMVKKQML